MGLAREDRLFSYAYQYDVSTCGCTYGFGDIACVLVAAVSQSGFVDKLNLVAIHFFQGCQYGLSMCFFSVEYPGTHLVVRGIR